MLNLTSQKKRDTMLCYTDVNENGPEAGPFVQDAARMAATGASFFTFAWSPTARPAEDSEAIKGHKIDLATRTNHRIFAKGLKENVQLVTNSGNAWQWRRVCFTLKGDQFMDTVDPDTSSFFRQTSNGMVRLVKLIPNEDIFIPLFRGARDQDWIDPFNAALNTDLATIKYDKVRHIQSGNASGVFRNYKLWHGMNQNILYRDEEDGDTLYSSPRSTTGKQGMGDYYVVDFFRAIGGTSSDYLDFLPQASFYWHEK